MMMMMYIYIQTTLDLIEIEITAIAYNHNPKEMINDDGAYCSHNNFHLIRRAGDTFQRPFDFQILLHQALHDHEFALQEGNSISF